VKKIGISTENLPSVAQATAAIINIDRRTRKPARRHRILKLAACSKSGGSVLTSGKARSLSRIIKNRRSSLIPEGISWRTIPRSCTSPCWAGFCNLRMILWSWLERSLVLRR